MTAHPPWDDLGARMAALMGPRHRVAAVATISRSDVMLATTGCSTDDDFEIGSVSKGITGLLYADSCERDEVSRHTTLGDIFALGSAPAGRVTLDSISRHRSGLPRLPRSALTVRRTIAFLRDGTNPYGETLPELLEQARETKVARPRPHYSNFGFELLGHALARAAGTTYADLVATRIAGPLGLTGLYVPATPGELRPSALVGSSKRGAPRQPWTGEALGPAGGIRASILDLARLVGSIVTATVPGMAALDPVEPFGKGARIGAAWITSQDKGRTLTWHNGGTGGFRSWVGMDRQAGHAVAIVSATSASVDKYGFTLLGEMR